MEINTELNARNFRLFSELWETGFGGKNAETTCKGWIYPDVDLVVLDDFIRRYDFHAGQTGLKSDLQAYLDLIADRHPKADVLLISPTGGSGEVEPFTLLNQERKVSPERLEGAIWKLNKDRVASRGDEKLGLSDAQKAAAVALAEGRTDGGVSDTHYREVRSKPLLMLHSLHPKSDQVQGPIAAFGMSFPFEKDIPTINVVVNKIWLQQQQGPADSPDDEEED